MCTHAGTSLCPCRGGRCWGAAAPGSLPSIPPTPTPQVVYVFLFALLPAFLISQILYFSILCLTGEIFDHFQILSALFGKGARIRGPRCLRVWPWFCVMTWFPPVVSMQPLPLSSAPLPGLPPSWSPVLPSVLLPRSPLCPVLPASHLQDQQVIPLLFSSFPSLFS